MSLDTKITALNNWLLSRPKTSGMLVFIILLSVFNLSIYFRYQTVKEIEQHDMANILGVVKQNIEQTMRNSYVATITLALTIDDSGNPKNFEEVSKSLVNNYNSIDAVQLVPNGIIKYTYPIQGNEAATNFDILHSPLHRKAALKAIKTKAIYFSGPVALKQGGIGVVGRLPIFKKGKFWGFSAVVVHFNTFLKSTGFSTFKNDKYYFQISKINPITNKEEFFLENKSDFSKSDYQKVEIPEGDWTLYIIPKKQSYLLAEFFPVALISFLLSLLCGLFVTTLLKKPSELQELVKLQT